MQIRIKHLLAICLSALCVNAAQAGLYRWTDETGKTHYSDQVPPSYSQRGHTELSESGIAKKVVLSAKQKQAIEAEKAEQKKRDVKRKEKEKQLALEEMRDIQLLNMFTSEKELRKVYQSKLEMTDESINLLKARHRSQSRKLERLENQYERVKNPQLKDSLAGKIDILLDNLTVYQQAITENYVEKEKINAEYAVNLKRFSELMLEQKKQQASN